MFEDNQDIFSCAEAAGEQTEETTPVAAHTRKIELMAPLRPIYNLFKDSVIDYDVASCDATTLQVLHEPGRKAETKSYVYCIRGGPPDKSVILYDYNDVEHKQFVYDWFLGFNGYLEVANEHS